MEKDKKSCYRAPVVSEPPRTSPFFHPGTTSSPSSLAVLHLRRDQLLPTFLSDDPSTDSGYAEGQVANTRFGSYPHSTLIGIPWGSQVVASQVDTGSRGRRDGAQGNKKRKGQRDTSIQESPTKKVRLEANDEIAQDIPAGDGTETPDTPQTPRTASEQQQQFPPLKKPSAAASGFCHIIPPTPESWTISLPHRTQVVYTPDYSFIIQKMRIRPGAVVLEAGAGSGSFTHAAARAVFNGYPPNTTTSESDHEPTQMQHKFGRVYSYEYHASRAEQLTSEIAAHGLDSIITTTHRDVYTSGFLLPDGSSPAATHIFLDLPSPWHALRHLTRTSPSTKPPSSEPTPAATNNNNLDQPSNDAYHPTNEDPDTSADKPNATPTIPPPSPLDPAHETHICIFLPCIEQVQRAVSTLRTLGWVEISMHVLAHRRLDVRRDRVGLAFQGVRGSGVNATPGSVSEACQRLRQVEMHGRRYQNRVAGRSILDADGNGGEEASRARTPESKGAGKMDTQPEDDKASAVPVFRQGRLVHRTEPEIRSHTSYLVFAVLPMAYE